MQVFAIDMDGTALDNSKIVQELYEHPNHLIIIHTARSSSIRKETEAELRRHGIPYHALVMDKLRADVYIDDKNAGGLIWPKK
jgi:uncharacterized HAD superfamily protein